jgi:hypothetical protein
MKRKFIKKQNQNRNDQNLIKMEKIQGKLKRIFIDKIL